MTALGGFKIAEAPDLDQTGAAPGKAIVVAGDGVTFELATVSGGGGGPVDAADVTVTPAGGISATDVQAALQELDTEKQPVDSDLTAIAALTTTAFGRGLLELANQAALLAAAGAAAAVHVHAGEDITTGTIADARIAATIARDSEVSAAIAALSTVYQPLDADLTAIAALTTTAFGRSVLELADAAALRALAGAAAATRQIIAGDGLSGGGDLSADRTLTVNVDGLTLEISTDALRVKAGGIDISHLAFDPATEAELVAAIASLSTVYQPLDADLTALAALATNAAGRSVLELADPGGDRIAFWDDSAGAIAWLSLGTNLTITGTTLDAAGGGGGGSGTTLELDVAQTAHGLDVGDVVRFDGTDYVAAQADSAENAEVVGIVSAVADVDNFTLVTGGLVTGLSGLTAGSVYFLSPSTAGALTATEPSTVGQISKPVLIAVSTTSGWFFNMRGALVTAAPGTEYQIQVFDPATTVLTGDGKAFIRIPASLNGKNLVEVAAWVSTAGTSGTITIQIRNATQAADMLSTRITIDVNETDSKDAAAAVIDTANDDVATGDQIWVDVDVTSTGAKGLGVALRFA